MDNRLALRLKLGRMRVPSAECRVQSADTRHPTPDTRTMHSLRFFLLAAVLAGCGGSAGPEKPQIAVIPKGTTHEFWKSIHAGAEKAASELDVEVIWMGPQREDDRQLQIQVIQNFISRDVDAIVLAPLDARSLARPVEAAVERGIPVVVIDSDLDSEAYSSFVATNNFEGGRLSARRLAEVMNGRGKAIMLRVLEGSASTTAREEGFLAEIREIAPDITLLSDNQYAGATMEKALQVSQNLLNRFPEVEGIFTPNESSTQGMLRALQTAGRAGQVRLVGFDNNEVLLEGLRTGQIDGLTLQDPFDMGYRGVKTAVAILNGQPVEKQVDTRMMMVTPDNLNDPTAQELLHPDLSTWLDE
ncbi:MAG: substrate-binding domain-containing protein [Rhodothermia bacterium]